MMIVFFYYRINVFFAYVYCIWTVNAFFISSCPVFIPTLLTHFLWLYIKKSIIIYFASAAHNFFPFVFLLLSLS